nr:MAG TPA: hypothetical protein [Caudoviricetes sp.]
MVPELTLCIYNTLFFRICQGVFFEFFENIFIYLYISGNAVFYC